MRSARYAVVSVPGIAIRLPLTPVRSAVLPRDDDRAVVVAHARAVRQQRVLVREVRVGVERHGGDLVLALERRAVQRLDVRQHLVDLDAAGVDVAARQAVEHERVVRIRAVGDGDTCLCHSFQLPAPSFQLWSTLAPELVAPLHPPNPHRRRPRPRRGAGGWRERGCAVRSVGMTEPLPEAPRGRETRLLLATIAVSIAVLVSSPASGSPKNRSSGAGGGGSGAARAPRRPGDLRRARHRDGGPRAQADAEAGRRPGRAGASRGSIRDRAAGDGRPRRRPARTEGAARRRTGIFAANRLARRQPRRCGS